MPRQCEHCRKTFIHRQSLSRHRKKCKGSDVHVPIPVPYRKQTTSSDDHAAKLEHVSKLIENEDDEIPSPKDDDDVSIKDDTTDEDSSAEEFSDDEEGYDHYLWELLCIKCFKYNLSIYECMFRIISLYFALEKDDSYQEIMEDVEKKEKQGSTFVEGLDDAIEKNQHLIEEAVAEYRDDKALHWKDEPMNIWRTISIPSKYRCDWFTNTECHCERNTCSLTKRFRAFALTINAMEIDDLMQDIIEAVRNRSNDITRDDALSMELKNREQSILSKFKEAKDTLDKRGNDAEFMHKMLQKGEMRYSCNVNIPII